VLHSGSYPQAHSPETSEVSKFDIIVEGQTPAKDPAQQVEIVRPYIEAGATWWIESMWDKSMKQVFARLKQGPPVLG
ncbi:MAG: hypothetical protein L0Y56_10035, partial [Nitrospira sp.]|nr:hypothetical protein [Nitrospira sp.]